MIEFISQLPTEYQEVEYIQSSGTQYIDTGFVVNKSDSYVLEIYGLFPSQAQAYQGCNGYMQFFVSSKYGINNESSISVGNRDTVRIAYANQTATLTVNGSQVESKSWASYSGVNVKLGVLRMGDTNNSWFNGGAASGTIYGYKLWKDEVLVSDCIPCYRKSDNIVGLYDLVNGVFYTNAGTGNFAKGKNSNSHSDVVITPGGVILMRYALRRRMMMAAMASVDVSALSITYTGAHTDYGMVTMSDGARYRLLAFTSSGTLSIEQPVNCEVCVVGGGANGNNFNGGAGAYLKNQSVSAYNGGHVVVGAAQGVSSIGEVSVKAVSGKNGGTGGGAGSTTYNSPGTGDGLSKYPFGDTGFSLWSGKPHCAGGGAGGDHEYRYDADDEQYKVCYDGGNGGTNGSSGGKGARRDYVIGPGGDRGSGGTYGGGQGGHDGDASTPGSGDAATYYGSGGGGYGGGNPLMGEPSVGVGYQGIVYMRIPEEPPAYISDLALGALINVGTDGGAGTPNYEIADINNLVPGGVVLVRKDMYSKSEFGSNTNYPGSTLDNLIKTTIYNQMPQKLRDKMMDVSFNLSGSGDITRKMFALTCTMVGFGNNNKVAEGKALQLYTSEASRIKTLNGSATHWWLSSKKFSDHEYVWYVGMYGTNGKSSPSKTRGVVPAFVIPSETRYDAAPNTDGSYNLIL